MALSTKLNVPPFLFVLLLLIAAVLAGLGVGIYYLPHTFVLPAALISLILFSFFIMATVKFFNKCCSKDKFSCALPSVFSGQSEKRLSPASAVVNEVSVAPEVNANSADDDKSDRAALLSRNGP